MFRGSYLVWGGAFLHCDALRHEKLENELLAALVLLSDPSNMARFINAASFEVTVAARLNVSKLTLALPVGIGEPRFEAFAGPREAPFQALDKEPRP